MAVRVVLTRRCPGCLEEKTLRGFEGPNGRIEPLCRSCRGGAAAREPQPSNVVDLLEAKFARRRLRKKGAW